MDLDPDNFVIFGSGPLLAHGLRRRVGGLDTVACGRTWEHVRGLGVRTVVPPSGTEMIQLWHGLIEVSPEWITPRWDANELIDQADVIDGLRFARLEQVLAYKRLLRRPKDLRDITVLEAALGRDRVAGKPDRPNPNTRATV